MTAGGRARCPQRAAVSPRSHAGALSYYMRKSAQSAKILGTPPERGHSWPQQLPNTQRDRNVRELYFRSTLLRTGMSAVRFGSGSAGLGTARPTTALPLAAKPPFTVHGLPLRASPPTAATG